MQDAESIRAEIAALEKKLTTKHFEFAKLVLDPADPRTLKDKYRAIYPKSSSKTAEANSSNILSSTKCGRYIELVKTLAGMGIAEKLGLHEERLIKEIGLLATSNPQDYLDEAGNLKDLKDLTRDQAASVTNYQVIRDKKTGKKIGFNYTFIDKKSSLELLGKTRASKLFVVDDDQRNADIESLLGSLRG